MNRKYILIDDINANNNCILISQSNSINNDSISISDSNCALYNNINNYEEFMNYFIDKYGEDSFEFLCKEFQALNCMKNLILNNSNRNDISFSIATMQDNQIVKYYNTPVYKYAFNKKNGMFIRWRASIKQDVKYAPMGPEIADIEISTICHGLDNIGPCSWCYKSNTPSGKNMSFDSYKKYIDLLNQNKTLTQVALGIGDIDANYDLEKILKYTRENDIIPNITINGARMNDYYFDLLVENCGAVSISRYNDDDLLFNVINRLDKMKYSGTLNAINIHQLLCKDTYDDCKVLLEKISNDKLLEHMINAIVFLTLKPIGKRNIYKDLVSAEQYHQLIDMAMELNINVGFDSCGCYNFLKSIKNNKHYDYYHMFAESCESTLFSIYVDVFGQVYPCSFAEHYNGKITDIREPFPNLNNCKDLLMDVWHCEACHSFRRKLLYERYSEEYQCSTCPLFNLVS